MQKFVTYGLQNIITIILSQQGEIYKTSIVKHFSNRNRETLDTHRNREKYEEEQPKKERYRY